MTSKVRSQKAVTGVSTLASWMAHSEEVSWLEYLRSPGRGPCGEEPTCQHQHASSISELLGKSILDSQSDFRQQSHRQHRAAASWESWPTPANPETPKCLAQRRRKITNCSSCPKKSTKLWCYLLHMKRVTNTATEDRVGGIFVPFCWRIYLQPTDITRLVRPDIVNALRRLWLYQLFTQL